MTDTAILEVQRLRDEVSRLLAHLFPFVGTDEMCIRYDCTPKTLSNMERDGRIPFRKNGRWSRVELVKWESKLP